MPSFMDRFRAEARAYSEPRSAGIYSEYANEVDIVDISSYRGRILIKLKESQKDKKTGIILTLNLSANAVAMLMATVVENLQHEFVSSRDRVEVLESRYEDEERERLLNLDLTEVDDVVTEPTGED